jgi:ferredoxin
LKVEADLEACQGYLCCLMAAPEVFDIDDDTAKVVLRMASPSEDLRPKVEDAVRSCPSRALRITEP